MSKKLSRPGLADITNTRAANITTPARNMNLALLGKKGARSYLTQGTGLVVPSVKLDTKHTVPVSASAGPGSASGSTATGFTTSTTNTGADAMSMSSKVSSLYGPRAMGSLGSMSTMGPGTMGDTSSMMHMGMGGMALSRDHTSSPLGCGLALPVDDFAPMGVNPHKFTHLEAARDAFENGGAVHHHRISSSFAHTEVIMNYVDRDIDMHAVRRMQHEEHMQILRIQAQEAMEFLAIPASGAEWYEDDDKDASLSNLSIDTIEMVDNHAMDAIEGEFVQERLNSLEEANKELQEQLDEARLDCVRMQSDIEAGDGLHNEMNQQLLIELAAKNDEVLHLKATVEEKNGVVAELEQVAVSMEQMNTGLSEELRGALNMVDDARDREEEMSATAASRQMQSISESEHASEEFVLLRAQEEEAQELVQLKQNVIGSLEEEISILSEQLQGQANTLAEYQKKVIDLEECKVANVQKIADLEEKQKKRLNHLEKANKDLEENNTKISAEKSTASTQVQTVQAALNAKCDQLLSTLQRAEMLEDELKYKDEELMMLLQSSVQSSDIAAKKLEKVEMQLLDKTSALKSANETSANYLKRHNAFEHKEQEMIRVRDSHTKQIEELQGLLNQANVEKDMIETTSQDLQTEASSCHNKIRELENTLKTTVELHMVRLNDQKERDVDVQRTRKDLNKAKIKITELESNIRKLRLSTSSQVPSSRSPASFQLTSPFADVATPIAHSLDTSDIIPAPTPPGSSSGQAASSLSSTISLLESQMYLLESKCKETTQENELLREKYDASQRDIESITDELHRSRSSLEKQLKGSTESESELATKVCDLNAQLEQLMSYSMKLTGELSQSKETEMQQMSTVQSQQAEMDFLRSKLAHSSNSHREEEVAYNLKQKEQEVEHWKTRLTNVEREHEKLVDAMAKAKQSKVRRYNKYMNLQQDYKLMVAQVERLVSENSDLRQRHKVFVKTVEAALVGGEGKIALDKFKERDSLPGSEAANRSILEMSQELIDDHMINTMSDIDEASDVEAEKNGVSVSPKRCF